MISAILGRLGGPYIAVALFALAAVLGIQTVRLAGAKADLARTAAAFAKFKADVQAKGEAQEKQVEYVDREIVRVVEVGRQEDAAKISDLGVRLRIARDELRVERGRRANLKDPNDAPAQCADYAAVPERLSVAHAEFLVGEAARAEFIAVQRDGCIRDYNAARERINALTP